MDLLETIKTSIRWIDILDILIVAFIIYYILLMIKGTRAAQMLTGLVVLGLAYFLSVRFDLFTLNWLLAYFFNSLILIVIVLFQDDLRRALTHAGKNPFFSSANQVQELEIIDEVTRAVMKLAKEKTGALIAIERETGLRNFIDTGAILDSKVGSELLYSIFIPQSPIHDGAVIISEGRLAAAGCFLPLTKNANIDKNLGTRHRAAMGLSEETDAIIILVSEETGKIHLAKNGKLTADLSEEELRNSLAMLLELYVVSKGKTTRFTKNHQKTESDRGI